MKSIATYPQPSFARPFAGALPMLLCLLGMLMGSTSARADQINVQYQAFRNEVLNNKPLMAKSKKWLESKWKSGKTKDSSKNKTTENKKKGKAVLVLLIVLFSLILLFAGLFLFALHTLYPVDPDETRPYFMMAIGSILGLIITGIKLRRLNKPEAETRTKPIRKVN